MRYILVSVFMLASTIFVCAQGPCTESVVKQGNLLMADDAFSYMPPFGKPVVAQQSKTQPKRSSRVEPTSSIRGSRIVES